MQKRKKGFTLIELTIAIGIVAVLVGMILPRFQGMRDQARISKAQGELRTIKTALESYRIANEAYPATSTSVTATYLAVASATPRVLTSPLYDPFSAASTTEYNYTLSSNGQYYVISSVGSDGVQNLTGIATNGSVTGTVGDDLYVTSIEDSWSTGGWIERGSPI